MVRKLCAAAALGLVTVVAGCPAEEEDLGERVVALFELPAAGGETSEFYALPFPNDLRLDADGTIAIATHPWPFEGFLASYLDTFDEEIRGFGTSSAIYFRFSAPLDPASLPADAAAALGDDASVYLVDVDPSSPDHGRKVPIKVVFKTQAGELIGPNWLACLPYPGFPLRPRTTYAAVVTARVRGVGGVSVVSSDDFERVRAGSAAEAVYRPLRDLLGDDLDGAVSATVFTTQDTVSLMGRLREVVRRPCAGGQTFPACIPPPVAREVSRRSTSGAFDTFEGVYDAPNFQTGSAPYTERGTGAIVLDASGAPIAQRLEEMRFALTIPNGQMPAAGWPIVLYAHGTGGDYRSFIGDGTAGRMAAEGLATISIDQVLHGDRGGGASEDLFFNFINPVAGRDNVRQAGADNFQLVRLVESLTVAEGPTTHRFDADKISFMGHSQGGLTGPPFLAYEPRVKAAVLSGAGGLIYVALLEKTNPIDLPALIQLLVPGELDEVSPILSMVQMFIEPADPVNYGPLIVREPPPGVPAKDVYQSEGLVDTYAPPAGIEALGVALGLAPVEPMVHAVPGFTLRGRTPLVAPVSANLGGKTGVFLQYNAPSGQDGHFVVFRVDAARRQHARFLGTAAAGTATLVP